MTVLIKRTQWLAWLPFLGFLTLTSCGGDSLVGDLRERYPTEIESCTCRFLAFQADGYTRVTYDEILNHCNEITRRGHPSLPQDIRSEPSIETLRCTEDVADWEDVLEQELAQQESNRKNYKEIVGDKKESESE